MLTDLNSIDEQSKRSIQAISTLEQQALQRRTSAEKVSDFVVYHTTCRTIAPTRPPWFGVWIAWNTGRILGVHAFDPFPFLGLSTVVSLEAIFLSLFILVSQNRATRRADERAHLDLQVNLLAEREGTKMLQLLQALCAHHGLAEAADADLKQLLHETEPAMIARELEQQLPAENNGRKQ